MPRAALPSGRKSLLFFALAAVVIGGAWWWLRPPSEPVYQGQRLSELVFDPEFPRPPGGWLLARERLHGFGPAGVTWLAYQVEHGWRPTRNGPLPFQHAPDWLRRWASDRWGGLRASVHVDEQDNAAKALEFLWEAAPAVPALARSLNQGPEPSWTVAITLDKIGLASWPVVHEALQHGNEKTRRALMVGIMLSVGSVEEPAPDAEVAHVFEALLQGCRDPDIEVRWRAALGIGLCHDCRPDATLFEAALPELIRLLADPDYRVREHAARGISFFDAKGAPAIPRLIELLDDGSAEVRHDAAWALARVDHLEKRSATRLRAMLHDPNADCRKVAAHTLEELGLSPGEESTGLEHF